ncbi:MAG TPA: sporulation protein YunB [Bacillales bacterium]|nr:sporulation protein YunB [Bacillales bacterium]
MFKPRGRFRLRRRPKTKRPLKFRQIFVISFLIFILLTAGGLVLINQGLKPTLMTFAKMKTESIAQRAITYAVGRQIEEASENVQFIYKEKDENGNVELVTIDMSEVNQFITQTTERVQNFLTQLEKGKLEEFLSSHGVEVVSGQYGPAIMTIPLGQATNNALLANLGPEVPVRFRVVGNVNTNPKERIVSAGINFVHYRLYVHVEVEVSVIIPFAAEPEIVESDIPIANTLVKGDVPYYYSEGGEGDPGFMLPPPKKERTRILR